MYKTEDEIRELAQVSCEKNGFELLEVKEADGEHLRIVLAYNEVKGEYATWLLNLSIGGLHHGHYFSHRYVHKDEAYHKAFSDFQIRS